MPSTAEYIPCIGEPAAFSPKSTTDRPPEQGVHQSQRGRGTDCKACHRCRARKVKCDGSRPRCRACIRHQSSCAYPRDSRYRQGTGSAAPLHPLSHGQSERPLRISAAPSTVSATSTATASSQSEYAPTLLFRLADESVQLPTNPGPTQPDSSSPRRLDHPCIGGSSVTILDGRLCSDNGTPVGDTSDENDQYFEVLAPLHRIFAPPYVGSQATRRSKVQTSKDPEVTKSRLIANSALQRQQENIVLRSPEGGQQVDYDGLDPPLAIHLLDLYWNSSNLNWLLTYRSAVMSSLCSGGPHLNKLLLNAIYLSSSLFSDRAELRTDPADAISAGMQFYPRFRQLLVEEVDQPSIPTAVALYICSTSLICRDKIPAGRMLCGIANRMVIELGCHLVTQNDCCDKSSASDGLSADLEAESRKRLCLGAFSINVSLSLYLGSGHAPDMKENFRHALPLDTYEELEEWSPYIDPVLSTSNVLRIHRPQPAYIISAGLALTALLEICSDAVQFFYSDAVKMGSFDRAEKKKTDLEARLSCWQSSLPEHLRIDRLSHSTAPPHQLELLFTFYTTKIVVQRPFLEHQALRNRLTTSNRSSAERNCIEYAAVIADLIEKYRNAFSLRRVTLLTSISLLLALSIMVERCCSQKQALDARTKILWSAVRELSNAANASLRVPLKAIERRLDDNLRQIYNSGSLIDTTDRANDVSMGQRNQEVATDPEEVVQTLIERERGQIDCTGDFQINQCAAGETESTTDEEAASIVIQDDGEVSITQLLDALHPTGSPRGSPTWIHAAVEISQSQPLLHDALQAFAKLVLGKISGNLRMEQSGKRLHIHLLRHVNNIISQENEIASVALFCTVVLLATVELFERKSESSIGYHWMASLTILERRGPLHHVDGVEHTIFTELRIYWVTWALTARNSTFLSQEEWKKVPWASATSEKDALQHLLDKVLEIPAFLEQVDKARSLTLDGADIATEMARLRSLSAWATSLQGDLHQWKRDYADVYPKGQPYEEIQNDAFPLFRHDDKNKADFTALTVLMYPDLGLANSLCLYNAAHLILLASGLLPEGCQHSTKHAHAWDICRSVQFFLRAARGPPLVQLEFPLRIAYDSFQEGSMGRNYIKEVCQFIRRSSKLEVFSGILERSHTHHP